MTRLEAAALESADAGSWRTDARWQQRSRLAMATAHATRGDTDGTWILVDGEWRRANEEALLVLGDHFRVVG